MHSKLRKYYVVPCTVTPIVLCACRYGTFAYKGLVPIPGVEPLDELEEPLLDELEDLVTDASMNSA
jgi:hypothetical protein